MLVPLLVAAGLVGVIVLGLRAADGVRGFVGGESLWTKSQKAGVAALTRYAITEHPGDFVAYERSRAVPEADRLARLEFQQPEPDREVAAAALIRGGNHPRDADAMAWLFANFRWERHLAQALEVWSQGDVVRDRIHAQALQLRAVIERDSSLIPADSIAALAERRAERIRAIVDTITVLDAAATQLESEFSATIGAGGRWLRDTLVVGTVLIGLVLAAIGAVAIGRLSREERRTFALAQQRDAERLAAERTLREREEQLRQSQKMEAVGRLAGGIAHDFNNLLMVMRGNLELARETVAHDPEAAEDLLEISRAVDRAAALTSQLLTFSRQKVPELRVLRLHEVVESSRRMLARVLGAEVRLDVDVPPDLPPVLADGGQLEQVLLNLAVNARDAMPEGGTLRLRGMTRFGLPARVGPGTVVSDVPADWVVLEVTDSGVGIPPELYERVFEPFFTTKEVGKGTGLGLATAYGIMAGIGGAIDVAPGEFGGTTFTLWLPPTEVRPDETRPVTVEYAVANAGRILVVEDQPEVRRLTTRILERAGYVVTEAAHGREALALLAQSGRAIDLVISDVVMPEVGGRALAETLRRDARPVPMIFISGYTPDLEPLQDPFGEPAEVLLKPFRAADLLARVQQELARTRPDVAAE